MAQQAGERNRPTTSSTAAASSWRRGFSTCRSMAALGLTFPLCPRTAIRPKSHTVCLEGPLAVVFLTDRLCRPCDRSQRYPQARRDWFLPHPCDQHGGHVPRLSAPMLPHARRLRGRGHSWRPLRGTLHQSTEKGRASRACS
jgi:hypothetical protein